VRLTRRGRAVVAVLLVALLGAGATYVLRTTSLGTALGFDGGPACVLTAGGDDVDWSADDAMTATTVAGVGTRIGASVNGVAAAVARSLRVDREQPIAPDDAREVYRGLPDEARPTAEALRIALALLGDEGAALSCTVDLVGGDDLPRQDPGELGLTARADTVRLEMRQVFGKQPLGGFDPDGVSDGHVEGSAHYEGRAIDVFFRPVSEANQRLGWQQAMWAVAHADRLELATVIFDREIWTATRSVQGWRTYRYPGGATDNPVLLHEDHVHVDVVEGD
jgi:hypothetical protein